MRIVFIISVILINLNLILSKQPVVISPKNPQDPLQLPTGVVKKVLVVGGGLAGLSAALELADRGYQVTIKEKENRIGGKLFCIPVEVFPDEYYTVEHGFHGIIIKILF
jgi:heterodisulfide reductase subunit A-like polyferredoxin